MTNTKKVDCFEGLTLTERWELARQDVINRREERKQQLITELNEFKNRFRNIK